MVTNREDASGESGFGERGQATSAGAIEAGRRLRETPPRCLAGFRVRADEGDGVWGGGHATNVNVGFELSCSCGHDRFFVLGHRVKTVMGTIEAFFSDPLALQCARCEKVTELIDTARHGLNGELESGTHDLGTAGCVPFACDRCGVRPMTAVACFEYSDDVFGFPEDAGREQELFSWFTLVGRCAGCDRVMSPADYETA